MPNNKILVTCAKGIAPFLKQELERLGFPIQAEMTAGIAAAGTLAETMKLNLHLRTGQRVLYFLDEFHARSPDELYAKLTRLRWEDYIPAEGYLSVTSSVHTSSIKDTRFANLKGKDAIVDRLMQKRGKRPDSGPARDRTVVFLHWKEEACSVYLDTSGEPLAKRGYRQSAHEAPMQETLAAAAIMATNWNGATHFINPMCGSGTLAIEAALLALNKAPGLLRSNFGFMHLNPFEAFAWNHLKKSARLAAKKNLPCKIIATDHSEEAVRAARENAYLAGVDQVIEFRVCDFMETPMPEGGGIVMLNPEYGVRMGDTKTLEETYGRIGDFFKQKCPGYTGYIFTGNLELAKKVGLRARRRIPFFNGEIECRLLEYELYEGSRKHASGAENEPG